MSNCLNLNFKFKEFKFIKKITKLDLLNFISLLIVLIFLSIKICYADIPFIYDEAWFYGPAVHQMTIHGPSLLPGSIPAHLSRGHPLLFYFLSSLWLRIFGYSIFNAHLFAIFISALYLFVTYYFTKKFYDIIPAFVTLILVALQPVVQAQAAMLLPDMLMALLTLLIFQSYLLNKIILFNIFATLLIFTKETGIAVWFSVFLFDCFNRRHEPLKNIFMAQLKLFSIPSILIALFFILQKKEFGWYLFPGHTALISHNIKMVWERAMRGINFIFLRQGRYAFSIMGLIVIMLTIILKKPLGNSKRPLMLTFVFTVIYIFVMSLNFITWRYMILLITPYFACIIFLIYQFFKQNKIYFWLISCLFIGFFLYNTIEERSPRDVDNGCFDNAYVTKQAIQYLENKNLYDTGIYCIYMNQYLTCPEIGYLSGNQIFKNLKDKIDSTTKYIVFSDMEKCYFNIEQLQAKEIICFRKHKSWCKIYQINE